MTEATPTKDDVWIIVGNAHAYGKGTSFREAFGNMCKAAGYDRAATEAIIYRWLDVSVVERANYYVDEMGTVHSSLIAPEVKRLHIKDAAALKKLHSAYYGFMDAVEEFEYSGEMAETFE